MNGMRMNEDTVASAQFLSHCSWNRSPIAVRVDHRITFSSASVFSLGIRSCLAKFTSVTPGRGAARSHLQRSGIAMKGSISLKKQYIVSIPWYLALGFSPRHNSAERKMPSFFQVNICCSVNTKIWKPLIFLDDNPRHPTLPPPHASHSWKGFWVWLLLLPTWGLQQAIISLL